MMIARDFVLHLLDGRHERYGHRELIVGTSIPRPRVLHILIQLLAVQKICCAYDLETLTLE